MVMTVGTSGGNKDVQTITVGTAGGNKAVLEGYVGTTGGNKLFYSALTAVAAPATRNASGAGATPITTLQTTATPSGGVGPFTYAWTIDNPAITILAPTAAATAFRAGPVNPGDFESGSASCVVTDTATGATATTNNVSVTITRI